MERALETLRQFRQSRWLAWAIVGTALLILGASIYAVTFQLRERIRAQMLGRDGEVLQAVALMHQFADESELPPRLDDPLDQLTVLLKTSRLRGVLAARLFDADGAFVAAFPPGVRPDTLDESELPQLRRLTPVHAFAPAARLPDFFSENGPGADPRPVPLLTVSIPLYYPEHRELQATAQFILDGTRLAEEFALLDRHLWRHGLLAFLLGSTLLGGALVGAFQRLQRANQRLAERTASLLQANHELTLAAKTSAIGALSAHLIHGLKNPLSGLQSFVKDGAQGADAPPDWADAVATTQRMQTLVSEVVRVLNEEHSLVEYEVTLSELIEMIVHRLKPRSLERGVQFESRTQGDTILSNSDANLVSLILENLVQNALEATPSGMSVRLLASVHQERVRFEVQDEGPGMSPDIRKSLFAPCQSGKPGGSGLGLAISKHLAKHLHADLELLREAPTTFALSLPLKRAASRAAAGNSGAMINSHSRCTQPRS